MYSSIDKVSLEIAISKPVVKIPDDVGKAYRVAAETKKRYPNYKAGEEAEMWGAYILVSSCINILYRIFNTNPQIIV